MMQVMRMMMTAIVVAAMVMACAPLVVGQEAAGDTATPQTPAPQEAAGDAAAAEGDDDAAAEGTDRVTDGLVALYLFDEVIGDALITDRVRPVDGLELLVRGGEANAAVSLRDDAVHFGEIETEVPGLFSVGPATVLVQELRSSGRLTVEAWVTPATDTAAGPARIVSISRDASTRNITLGQTQDHYILRLRTSATNVQGWPELEGPEGTLLAGELQHVVVTFDGWTTVMYLDGEPIAETEHFGGTLEGWDDTMSLILGNEFDGERLWSGAIHLVAIYSYALTPEQVLSNYEAGF